jgi:UDP-N-acetylmuramoylalanine--D-glutamate ligase
LTGPRPPLPAGPYLVVGLARSGVAAALTLASRGERVLGLDAGSPAGLEPLAAAGVELHLGVSGTALLERARAVVKSPGVPRSVEVLAGARERGIPVLGELELAWRLLPNEFIAVTGTNGKTTTVELIGFIHALAERPAAVAGNVGRALSSLVGVLDPAATIVCEASSFQLEDALAFAPEAGVLLNVTPDHIDRHGSFEAYLQAKLSLFAHQGNDDIAVAPAGLGVEDLGGCARRVCFGQGPGPELSEQAGQLWWNERPLLGVEELRLRGRHNVQNAMAAAAVCLARGVDLDAVRAGLRTFTGVQHRLEEVATRAGVLFVNDSKATNVASTLVALEAFPGERNVHLILGGQGKDQDFTPLRDPIGRGCAAVYLIGRDAPLIDRDLDGVEIPVELSGTLERAVADAARAAAPGEVVLLSPACASFDQFTDFEDRGRRFRALVEERPQAS